jgi:glycosyltransferase involved in cell wall biosynthesis
MSTSHNKAAQGLPLVTIIIPTFNQSSFLPFTIASALAQDYENLEVIVVDDCSPDNTKAIATAIGDSRLRYFHNENNLGRVGNYRKALYEYARGEWVLNLDGDDVLLDTGFIGAAIAAAQGPQLPVFVFADRYERDDPFDMPSYIDTARSVVPEYLDGTRYILSLPKQKTRIHHLSVLYRRDAAMAIDFYRVDIISSDYESLWRLALGRTIAHLPCRVAIWRRHTQNASRGVKIESAIRNYALFDGVRDHAAKNLDYTFQAPFDRWLTRNVANRYYGTFLSHLRSGNFENLAKLRAFVRMRYPRAYRKAMFSPKTIVRGAIALLRYAVTAARKHFA